MIPSPPALPICEKCDDTGWEPIEGKVRPCSCVAEAEQAEKVAARLAAAKDLLASIPEEFRWVDLRELKPDVSRHPQQAMLLAQIQEAPFRSRALFGANGIGKTMFGWGVYRLALEAGRPAYGIKLRKLLRQYRAAEFDDGARPLVTADELAGMSESATVFLDDIGLASPSAYAGGELYDLVDVIYERAGHHQLIVTSHSTPGVLEDHWDKAGDHWGRAIMRRIVELRDMHTPDLF